MKKTAVVYWSSTGNTEAMAQAVLEGMKEAGAEAVLLTPDSRGGSRAVHENLSVGDTIRVRTTIKEVRASKSRPDVGIVTFLHQGLNQRDEEVCMTLRQGMMLRRPKAA